MISRHSPDCQLAVLILSRQYENVLIEQSRNVLLTGLTLEVANRRTTTHESGRSGSIGGFEKGQGRKDDATAGGRGTEDQRAPGKAPVSPTAKGGRQGGPTRTARPLQPADRRRATGEGRRDSEGRRLQGFRADVSLRVFGQEARH